MQRQQQQGTCDGCERHIEQGDWPKTFHIRDKSFCSLECVRAWRLANLLRPVSGSTLNDIRDSPVGEYY